MFAVRRTNWVKNWWVLICTRLTATVALSQTTIYKRIGSPSLPIGLLSVLVGNSESLHEIFAEDRGPEFVLRPEFDPIRDYIKSALVLPENLPQDTFGEGQAQGGVVPPRYYPTAECCSPRRTPVPMP